MPVKGMASMSAQQNKEKSTRQLAGEERLLKALLREHERICEEIITLLSKTNGQTTKLIRTLEEESKEPGSDLPIQ